MRKRHEPAVRLHHQGLPIEPQRLEIGRQIARVACDQGLEIALHDGGAGTLEFVVLPHDRAGNHHFPVGIDGFENSLGAFFMHRVRIRVQEGNDDGLEVLQCQGVRQLLCKCLVKRRQDVPAMIHPLGHLPPHGARDQRLLHAGHAIHVLTVTAAKFQHVAEAFGGD